MHMIQREIAHQGLALYAPRWKTNVNRCNCRIGHGLVSNLPELGSFCHFSYADMTGHFRALPDIPDISVDSLQDAFQ